ncbi:MAG: sugar transferase, partial [Candidatus Dormibacteraceae bacterium]
MSLFNPSISSRERHPLNLRRKANGHALLGTEVAAGAEAYRVLTPEPYFLQAVSLERKRAERSGKHFLLMLLGGEKAFGAGEPALYQVRAALAASIRETDLSGWYRQGRTMGVIFTEVKAESADAIMSVLHAKVSEALRHKLRPEHLERIQVSFYLFPETTGEDGWQPSADSALYPEVRRQNGVRKLSLLIKRLLDTGGSAAALIVLSPCFAFIAVAIKLSSKGPVLYRQVRIGQYGKRFTFLKFRSMHVNSSATIHQEFVRGLIRGKGQPHQTADAPRYVFKITE